MKKIFTTLILSALILGNVHPVTAQTAVELPTTMSVRVGAAGTICENVRSYFNHRKAVDLLSMSVGITAGYDFTPGFGVRLTVNRDKNSGACNSLEAGGGFYPYTFTSLNVFADAMLNKRKIDSPFVPKFYAGIGGAHTYAFEKAYAWSHSWETHPEHLPHVQTNNMSFGFRFGFVGELLITPELGVQLDLCWEFYTDNYDGLKPYSSDQEPFIGYAGFPFDMRGIASVGMAYHF